MRHPDYLVFLHTVIRACVPLMVDAGDRLAAMPADPLAVGLRSCLDFPIRHIPDSLGQLREPTAAGAGAS